MSAPSPGYAITIRVEAPAAATATAGLTAAVSGAGGSLTALDVVESQPGRMVIDVSCDTEDAAHADVITAAIAAVPGMQGTRSVTARS